MDVLQSLVSARVEEAGGGGGVFGPGCGIYKPEGSSRVLVSGVAGY